MDGISREDVVASLSPKFNREMAFKAGESQGKSGSFFFFSHDKKFIIKSMNDSELKTFFKIFEEFSRHLEKHPNSLFARVYGIFTVKMEDIVPVHLILLNNIIEGKPDLVFDLKGSFINREVKKGESSVLKDVNLLHLCKKEIFLRFSHND